MKNPNNPPITDEYLTTEELRATAAEAAAELSELNARKGLEYLLDAPWPKTEPGANEFSRLAAEYNDVANRATQAPRTHLHYGKLFLICGMNEQAAIALERAVKQRPHSAETRSLYGRALAAIGELEAARGEYTKACELDPRLVESRFEREIVQFRIEERERARCLACLN